MSPFTTRLVGVAWEDPAQDAIALARALHPNADDGLILAQAYVFDANAPSQFHSYGDALREETHKRLVAAREAAGVPGAELLPIADPSPAHALHHVARERDVDAIVVGACHRGAIGRAILGDVARNVLHGAPCPVAVAPRGYEHGTPIRSIGVAFDGRPESDAALAVAAEAADALGATLTLRWVLVPPEAYPLSPEDVEGWIELADDLRDQAQSALDEALAVLDVPATGAIVEGHAARKLEELAEDVDLLVCGSRGWGTPKRVMLGSTSDHVIHHAACPVLVVPRAEAEAAPEAE